jgi:hypothetical protein
MTTNEAAARLRAQIDATCSGGCTCDHCRDILAVLDELDRLFAIVAELNTRPKKFALSPDLQMSEEEIQAWREAYRTSLRGPLVFRDDRPPCRNQTGWHVCKQPERHEGNHRDWDNWEWSASAGTWPEDPGGEAPTHRTERN